MTGYQRYDNMLRGRSCDYVPCTPILMQFAAEYIGSDYGSFAGDYRILVRANEQCARDFGMDQLSAISDPYRETEGFGSRIEYVRNGPPHSTHPLEESKDMSRLKRPAPLQSPRMLDRVQAIREYQRRHGEEYSILGWIEGPAAEAADLRGVMNFLMDAADDTVFAGELMDRCVEVGIDFARAQAEAGADTIGIGDAIASQVSPDTYEKFIQPREKKLIRAIRQTGARVKLHICGNITHLLRGIADLQVDILDVDHMVDMGAVRKAVGAKAALAGNIDPAREVWAGKPATIRQTILRTYELVGNPFLVNAGCEIPAGTPYENLKALCEPVPYRP